MMSMRKEEEAHRPKDDVREGKDMAKSGTKHPGSARRPQVNPKTDKLKAKAPPSQLPTNTNSSHIPPHQTTRELQQITQPVPYDAVNSPPAAEALTSQPPAETPQAATPEAATDPEAIAASSGERALEYVTPRTGLGNKYLRVKPHESTISTVRVEEPAESVNARDLDKGAKSHLKRVGEFLFGSPISTENASQERIGKVKALALLSSDALSSVAYGTEASLAILVTAGLGLGMINLWIGLSIIALLAIVAFSYRQTIMHYPTGGGSYIVAKGHLGETAGLVAAAALLLDYVLTVSVSISAGVDALVSSFGFLAPYTVLIGVIFIGLIVVVNLRGVRESGSIFAVPTYLFVGSYLLTLVVGIVKVALSPGGFFNAVPETLPAHNAFPINDHLGIFLILTAFASGCSAMTGTEAIADGVPVFQGSNPKEQSKNAATTLIIMATLLGVMYGGTTYLAWRFGMTPNSIGVPTVLSMIAQTIWGMHGFGYLFYILFQFATTLILTLAANTSFSDFPRLSSILARDDFMPHFFGLRGGRLAFNVGISVLGVLSGLLLWVFNGKTEALINLYALGVFTAFTLSQSGMVQRFRREQEPGWVHGAIISGIGAFVTGVVTLVIVISKTPRGAWVVLILVPLFVLMFKGIHRHYQNVKTIVSDMEVRRPGQIRHLIVVPFATLDNLAMRGLAYARAITPHVIAVHVTLEGDDASKVQDQWNEMIKKKFLRGGPIIDEEDMGDETPEHRESLTRGPQLVIIDSPYRVLERPLIQYIDRLRHDHANDLITVVLPEFVPNHFWERLLHNQTAFRLKLSLLGRSGVVTSNVPYRFMPATNGKEPAPHGEGSSPTGLEPPEVVADELARAHQS